jgi:hypothetical protein
MLVSYAHYYSHCHHAFRVSAVAGSSMSMLLSVSMKERLRDTFEGLQ